MRINYVRGDLSGGAVLDPRKGRYTLTAAAFSVTLDDGVDVAGELDVDADAGVIGMKQLTISSSAPLLPNQLRAIKWAKVLDGVLDQVTWKAEVIEGGFTVFPLDGLPGASVRRRRSGGRKLTDEHYSEVARIYRAHVAGSPVNAVADHFLVARSTAGGYVQEARHRGFLLPAPRPGAKGEQA